jgi:hypothetical protein
MADSSPPAQARSGRWRTTSSSSSTASGERLPPGAATDFAAVHEADVAKAIEAGSFRPTEETAVDTLESDRKDGHGPSVSRRPAKRS